MKACAACKGRYDDGIPEREPTNLPEGSRPPEKPPLQKRLRIYRIRKGAAAVAGLFLLTFFLAGCTESGVGINPISFLGKIGEASFGVSHAAQLDPDPPRVVSGASAWLRFHAQAVRNAD